MKIDDDGDDGISYMCQRPQCIIDDTNNTWITNGEDCEDSFWMSISEHSNGLASTIKCKCDKEKQDKRLSNHHLPQLTKHNSGETQYAALICYSINFQWVFGMQ